MFQSPESEEMSMSRSRKIALLSLVLVPVLIGGFVLQQHSTRNSQVLFDQVFSLVSNRFVDTLQTSRIYEQAARGLVSQLGDPYAALISPEDMAGFTVRTAGRYGGIGLLLEDQEGQITVTRVFPHTPGAEAGVERGDRIVAVEGEVVKGWPLSDVTDRLKGEPGTDVGVRFVRAGVGAPLEVKLTRAVIHIPSVPYAIMLDGRVGYLPLQQITETSATEVRSAIQELARQGMAGLVLDLRGNGGGYTDQALQITNFFLPRGTEVYSVQSRDPDPERFLAPRDPILPDLPLIVLTDAYSASASEIIAGALQDHDRALLVGNTSFGKGLVQSVFPLDNGWALKLTTGKWYTPSGRSIQRPDRDVGSHRVAELDSVPLSERPKYKSDGGRIVYGGGAITPDLLVESDTLTTAEQALSRAFAPKGQDVNLALNDLARELRKSASADFTVIPAWREQLWTHLQERGVQLDRQEYDAGRPLVDYLIENRVSLLAYGDSAAKRRAVKEDAQLRTAINLLKRGATQRDLFAMVESRTDSGAVVR